MDQLNETKGSFGHAAAEKRRGFVAELVDWMGQNKKWWLLPIVLAFVGLGALLIFGTGTGMMPFIYTLW